MQTLSALETRAVADQRLRLARWYLALSLLLIGAGSLATSVLLSRSMTESLLQRDAEVSGEFFNSIVRSLGVLSYFHGDTYDPNAPELEQFFTHVAKMPNVMRANVYAKDRTLIWSSTAELIGRKFTDNDDLENAFRGEAAHEIEIHEQGEKAEHVSFDDDSGAFVENYLPIWDLAGENVVGVIEVYRSPKTLQGLIRSSTRYVWIVSLLAALLVFAGLTLTLRRAKTVLEMQHARLLSAEKLAAVGETAAAVAHAIRNPLASIRSSAELGVDDANTSETNRMLEQIVAQTDRLEKWIRDFLGRGLGGDERGTEPTPVAPLLRECLAEYQDQMERGAITPILKGDDTGVTALANRVAMRHAINTLIANSIEAMTQGGELELSYAREVNSDAVVIEVADTGPGFRTSVIKAPFALFRTTKRNGLGVGLNMVRSLIERSGGRVELSNRKPHGARVRMVFPA